MELGERRRRILAVVVNDYVRTAEPVGSEYLAQQYDFGVKPATIRNELAAMSDLGYLHQPHTSAGRVPSDMGYRFYVDELMPDPSLEPGETKQAGGYDNFEGEIESILHRTCHILSELTNYTSVATTPQIDMVVIKHIVLSTVTKGKLLAVTMLNTGHVDHRVLDIQDSISDTDLVSMNNFINARFQSADMNSVSRLIDEELPHGLMRLSALYKKVAPVLRQALLSATDAEIFVDGTSHILKQPEFTHGNRVVGIMDAIEQRRKVFQILSRTILGNDVSVIIGAENQFEELQDCSFVTMRYFLGDRVCGSIGVIGPTRMDYRRAVAAVKLMSRNLSQLLTLLSIG